MWICSSKSSRFIEEAVEQAGIDSWSSFVGFVGGPFSVNEAGHHLFLLISAACFSSLSPFVMVLAQGFCKVDALPSFVLAKGQAN